MPPLELLCDICASFHMRGYAFGSTGNVSIRSGGDIWVTPTGRSLRNLTPDQLACISEEGSARNANAPSKESPFHLAAYAAAGGRAAAIVHLHSPWSTAMSCLADPQFPPITPYFQMRVAPLAVVPYYRPGSAELAAAVGAAARDHNCMLLRNHGIICLGRTLEEAVDRTEELEETSKLLLTLRGEKLQLLTNEELTDIVRTFGVK